MKTRIITMTDRQPVHIAEDAWPIIAHGSKRPGAIVNGTPRPDHQTDSHSLHVRQHQDGRAIVYGVLDAATMWTGTQDWRGGELLVAGADLAAAIRRVGESGGIIDSVIRACIADLPAEEL